MQINGNTPLQYGSCGTSNCQVTFGTSAASIQMRLNAACQLSDTAGNLISVNPKVNPQPLTVNGPSSNSVVVCTIDSNGTMHCQGSSGYYNQPYSRSSSKTAGYTHYGSVSGVNYIGFTAVRS